MSELTYKKIVDVETVEALNDAATVFINDNGAMKQVGADKFGAVKTVNGVEPDENGNITVEIPEVEIPEPVQPDWNQNDENAPDYVQNRTHYSGLQHITFNGDTDGLDIYSGYLYRVHSDTPNINDVIGGTMTVLVDGSYRDFTIAESWVKQLAAYPNDGYVINNSVIVFFNDVPDVAKAGIYFAWHQAICQVVGLSYNVRKTLDEMYIPDTIARKSDLEGLGGSGGAFVVNIEVTQENDNFVFKANVPFADIRNALINGRSVVCYTGSPDIESVILRPYAYDQESIAFNNTTYFDGRWHFESVIIFSDESVEMSAADIAATLLT